MKRLSGLGLALLLAAAPATAETFAQTRAGWNEPQKPFHIVGNIYYVGTKELAVYLIRTPDGDILIDGGLPEGAALIEHNIRALGVPLSAVKILLNSHAHFDHAGGLAKIKADSGARLYASAGDAPILERGHIDFGPSKEVDFPPVRVDRVLKDGEQVRLGGTVLTAHLTPGHTPGCTSWTMPVTEAGKSHNVIFYCSTTVAGNPLAGNAAEPDIVSEYRHSFAVLKRIEADVFLARMRVSTIRRRNWPNANPAHPTPSSIRASCNASSPPAKRRSTRNWRGRRQRPRARILEAATRLGPACSRNRNCRA